MKRIMRNPISAHLKSAAAGSAAVRLLRTAAGVVALVMAATLTVAPAVLAFDVAPAAADEHAPGSDDTSGSSRGSMNAEVQQLFLDEETNFFERGLGRRMRHLCTGLAIIGGILAVIRAALKGLFKSGGGQGGQPGGGGGGVGQYFKQLVMPLVACAMLLNLNWTFSGIEWTAKIGSDVVDEAQSWFESSPTDGG